MATETQLPMLPLAMTRDALLRHKGDHSDWSYPAHEKLKERLRIIGHQLFPNDSEPVQHLKLLTLLRLLLDVRSTTNISRADAHVFVEYAEMKNWVQTPGGPKYPPPDPQSIREAAVYIAENDEAKGQLRLALE